MKTKMVLTIGLMMLCLFAFPIFSKAGNANNFTIKVNSVELPIPNQRKDGKIEYLFSYERIGSKMSYQFKSANNWKTEVKKLNSSQAQIIVYIPYSSVKVIIPTSVEKNLQKISHTLIIYEGQYVQQQLVVNEAMRKVTQITIPSIYTKKTVDNLRTVIGSTHNYSIRGWIVSTPSSENSFKYIWRYMKIVAVQNENVVKISNVSKNLSNDLSGYRGELYISFEALNPGKAKIYAVSPTNQKILLMDLTVDDIVLDKKSLEIKKNDEATINVTLGAKQGGKWSSSNSNVVKIIGAAYNQVKIKGINAGTATITFKNKEGNRSRICKVTVKEDVKIPYKIQDKKYCTGIKKNISKEQIQKDLNSSEFKIKNRNGVEIQGNDKLGTGMKLEVNNIEYVLAIQGDLNGDGDITTTDISKLKEHIVEREMLQDEYKWAADMNGDGTITITDLAQLKYEIIEN